MNNEASEKILAALEQLGPVRREGKGLRTHCPNPSHSDRNPSFFLYPGGGGRCFSQCDKYWNPSELADLLGIELPGGNPGLTLQELAYAKAIPEDFLQSLGVKNGFTGSGGARTPCVDIPYMNESGDAVAFRKRLSLSGNPRFIWRRGDHASLYGLERMRRIREAGYVILVEGESDSWTMWLNGFPALGIPGASTWKEQYASFVHGMTVYLWHEPDSGGDSLVRSVTQDLPDVRIIEATI